MASSGGRTSESPSLQYMPSAPPPPPAPPPAPRGRLRSLDGLRGVAALVVLVHHSLLMIPSFAAPYFDGTANRTAGTWEWWVTRTPLHLFWEGTGAVYVFFILSGMVLTLPVLNARNFSWATYYPQRLVRLYVPIWAAVAFAVATILIVPRTTEMASAWIQRRPTDVTVPAIVHDMTLLAGNGGLASPLWSLQWEVLFSLLLPLFVVIAVKARRFAVPMIALCLVVIAVGGAEEWVRFMPMFLIGALLATLVSRLGQLKDSIDARRGSNVIWAVAATAGLGLLVSSWLLLPVDVSVPIRVAVFGLTAVGALLVVLVAAYWGWARSLLETRLVQWLGAISFSLYLTHEPIVIASAYLFGPGRGALAILVAIPAAFIVAQVFFLLVERPSHRLAKRIGRRFTPPPVASFGPQAEVLVPDRNRPMAESLR